MSEWSPPAGATPQQYTGGKDPDGSVQLADAIAKIRTTLGDLPHHLLKQAGIRVEPDLVRFTGAVRIEGTLDLPAGIIGNDALTSPIVYRTIGDGESGMAVSTTPTQSSVRTMTVPGGYTASGLVVLGSANIVNTTASTQYVYLQAYAVDTDGVAHFGGAAQITLAAGFAGSILAPLIRAVDGLTPGMNLTFYVELNASAAMTAHASNWTGIEVQAAFTR